MRTNNPRNFSHKLALVLINGLLVICLAALALNISPLPAARASAAPATTTVGLDRYFYLPLVLKSPTSWLDHIIFSAVPDPATAVAQLQVGTIQIYPAYTSDQTLYNQVKSSPSLSSKMTNGGSDQLIFNTVQCTDPSKLNPFHDPQIREAMNWTIDRNYVVQTILGGLGVPKFTALMTFSPDYTRYASVIGSLEASYAYDLNKAQTVVDTRMPLLGATKGSNGKWQYNGAPVTIIGLIRTEDARLQIGDYFAGQLELLGFTVDRQYKTRQAASPIWQGDPYPCTFNFYTAGWTSTPIQRDEGGNFAEFNSGQVQDIPLFHAYQPSPALATAENALLNKNFTTLDQRAQLFQTALTLSMQESWWGVWVVEPVGFEPYSKSVAMASDLASGIGGTPLWPYTLNYKTQSGGTMKIAQDGILIQPWNPIGGSNWAEDAMIQQGTSDHGLIPDPNTGLNLPKLVHSASVVARTGLPIFNSSSWLTLSYQDTIAVPADAWADWNATTQKFITAQQRAAADSSYHLTANIKSTVTYVPNLWQTQWHDGSNLSPADFVMAMILKFDPGKPASKLYNANSASNLTSFMKHFKGVKILSTDPLVIETYEDAFNLDAENSLTTWYPASGLYNPDPSLGNFTTGEAYDYGTAAWHNLALAIQAEADGLMAFDQGKADSLSINQTSLISGPTLAVQAATLNNLILTRAIPYAPTLGSYLTQAEISARYAALKAFYQAYGHLWIGTGPYFIDQVNPGAGTVSLARFAGYLFPPGQFWRYGLP